MTRRDGRGQDSVVWDSRNYGERLAVVGKDALTAGWPNRPFQVEWSPGEVVFLEVYDRKNGLLCRTQAVYPVLHERRGRFSAQDRRFSRSSPSEGPIRRSIRALNHIVLNSQLVGDLKSTPKSPAQVAADSDRPIVIK